MKLVMLRSYELFFACVLSSIFILCLLSICLTADVVAEA
jgi:hypothetical protein